ncbi:glycosyltransferase family 87 protein [Roseburia inulinivorans]|uniref:glycosyltransferase family 87 protein n=1 Tax=Roseburia inulinivorans TaxID=360807 RepID=UPI0032C1787E
MKISNVLKRNQITLYLSIIVLFCVIYYVTCIFSQGNYVNAVFANDMNDTFMDYFNSIDNAKYDPYYDKYSNYPAMACIIYKILFKVVPITQRDGNGFSLRNNQSAMVIFLVFNIISIWIAFTLISQRVKLKGISEKILILAVCVSAPFMFTLERGNLIFFSFILSMFFVFNYGNENRVIKEISFLALALAAAIKIYPALFGLILLKRRNIKETIRLVIYGIAAFILPFFYYDGFNSLKIMLGALGYTSNITEEIGYGINLSLYNICKTFASIFRIQIWDWQIYVIYVIAILGIIISFFIVQKRWLEELAIVLLIIFLPKTNYYYISIFLYIPFIDFINEWYERKDYLIQDYLSPICYFLTLVPWATNTIPMFSEKKFIVSYTMLLYYISLLWFFVILITEVNTKYIQNSKAINLVIKVALFVFSVSIFIATFL